MQLQPVELFGDGDCRAGQEARAHALGACAEPEVEARRLDLVGVERRGAASAPVSNSSAISRSGRILPAHVSTPCSDAARLAEAAD